MLIRVKTFQICPETLFDVVRRDPDEYHRAAAIIALTEWKYTNLPLLRSWIAGDCSLYVRLTIAEKLAERYDHPRYFVGPLLLYMPSAEPVLSHAVRQFLAQHAFLQELANSLSAPVLEQPSQLIAGEILLASEWVAEVPTLIERSWQKDEGLLPALTKLAKEGCNSLRLLILKGIHIARHDSHVLDLAEHLLMTDSPVSAEKVLAADILRFSSDFDQHVSNAFLGALEDPHLRNWASDLWDKASHADPAYFG
jgi:hypothetical protein